MAAAVYLSVNGKLPVQLETDIIYRIGRKPGLEFSIDDESMELAHATVSLLRAGVVRLAAVMGKVFVDNQETNFTDLDKENSTNGEVNLRFGNVQAKLQIKENLEEAPDSSGFEDELKDKSCLVPDTEPSSFNTTTDSCIIPETQALPLGRVSLKGEDCFIPETQDVFGCLPPNEENSSEMGSQIRICTQDFNEPFDTDDAIDDFDSSLILGPDLMTLPPPLPQVNAEKQGPTQAEASELEMSHLNWSALNSTKADSAPEDTHNEAGACTPDFLDFRANNESGACTPDLFDLPPPRETSNSPTQPLSGLKQTVVATIESNPNQINQDYIETQLFPRKVPKTPEINQDFIATQPFPGRNKSHNSPEWVKPKGNSTLCQDFIPTQPFPGFNTNSNKENTPLNQDYIETQPFVRPNPTVPLTLKLGDSIDKILDEMITGGPTMPSSSDDEEPIKFYKPCVIKDKNHNQKVLSLRNCDEELGNPTASKPEEESIEVEEDDNQAIEICQIEGVLTGSKHKSRSRSRRDLAGISSWSRKRSGARSESPPPTPSTKNRRLTLSPTEMEQSILKRSALAREDSTEPPSKMSCITPTKPKSEPKVKLLMEESENISKKENTVEIKRETRRRGRPAKNVQQQEDKDKEKENKMDELFHKKEKVVIESVVIICKARTKEDEKEDTKEEEKEEAKSSSKQKLRSGRKATKTADPELPKSSSTSKTNIEEKKKGNEKEEQMEIKRVTRARSKTPFKEEPASSTKKPAQRTTRGSSKSEEKKKEQEPRATRALAKKEKPQEEEVPSKRQTKLRSGLRSASKVESTEISKEIKKEKEEIPSISSQLSKSYKNEEEDPDPAISSSSLKKLKETKVGQRQKPALEEPEKKKEQMPVPSKSTRKAAQKSTTEQPSSSSSTNHKDIKTEDASVRSKRPENPLKAFSRYVKAKKAAGKIKICLSMCNLPALKSVLKSLTLIMEVTDDPLQCDLLIMDKGERTYKFLMVIASNKPILCSRWLHSIKKFRSLEVLAEHLFNDAKFEEVYKFNPLLVMEKQKLLSGYEFILSENIQPNAKEMKAIIQSAGGKVYGKTPPKSKEDSKLYVVTNKQDKPQMQLLMKSHVEVKYIKTEGVMQALVQHNPELLEDYQLQN